MRSLTFEQALVADRPIIDRYPREVPPQRHKPQPAIEAEMTPRPHFLSPHYRGAGKLDSLTFEQALLADRPISDRYPKEVPPQQQEQQPGIEAEMTPRPQFLSPHYRGSGKLEGKVALITGGDSGIGRAVAILYAREGADLALVYMPTEEQDAQETAGYIRSEGRVCLLIPGDLRDEAFCQSAVQHTVDHLGGLDIVVNNAAVQYPQKSIEDIDAQQLVDTFTVNIFAQFYLVQAALPHLKAGSAIINTTSVTAYQGNETLIDYSATKGAIVAFTRSLSKALVKRDIRVNGVAPGPIWTPLIPATFEPERVAAHGENAPMERVGQPEEVAPCYVFLASRDSSYMTGQILHPNGGTIVNG